MKNYKVYETDHIKHGKEMKIEHTLYRNNYDISTYLSMSLEEVERLRTDSAEKENTVFEKLKEAFGEWERQAAVTQELDCALAYMKTPEVQHSSNRLERRDELPSHYEISNNTYRMFYQFDDNSDGSCNVQWRLQINNPAQRENYPMSVSNPAINIAGQEKKFKSHDAAEKYIQGRIKAYSHLFKELYPPVPKEYAECFTVSGKLLPGYTLEGEKSVEKKPSLSERISSANAKKDSEALNKTSRDNRDMENEHQK